MAGRGRFLPCSIPPQTGDGDAGRTGQLSLPPDGALASLPDAFTLLGGYGTRIHDLTTGWVGVVMDRPDAHTSLDEHLPCGSAFATGVHRKSLQIGRSLPLDVRDAIRSTPTADSTTELLELARMPVDEQRKVADILHSGIKAPVKHLAAELRRDRQRQTNQDIIDSVPALGASIRPDEGFKTIVIDPPWDWGDEGDINQMGRAQPDYATMTLEEIAALPISSLAEPDAHMYR